MNKRLGLLIVALGIISGITFTGFSVWHSSRMTPVFDTAGYILCGDADEGKWLSFRSGAEYTSTLSGSILFSSPDTGRTTVSKESFAYFDDNSMMALSDGILLDFKDLSDNFINNYYLNAGLRISNAGSTYVAETSTGTMEFGEYLWKLSNQKFVVVSPTLKVHMSDDDVREVNDYVQVTVTNDKVVHLLTPENLWMTISEDCYIETEGGVQIYPVTQLIDNGNYKMSLAKLSVNVDDAIILTEDETRRQIVPELKIDAIDGEDGQDGEDGRSGRDGEEGASGEEGAPGKEGTEGARGEAGKAGENGQKGSDGAAGSAGPRGENGANGGDGAKGNDASTGTSANNPLPTMTITDWQISATGLNGTLKITDISNLLIEPTEGDESGISSNKYAGSVIITDTQTGSMIYCYPAGDDYKIDDNAMNGYNPDDPNADGKWFNFAVGDDGEIRFTTGGQMLEPDREYRLSVNAYYKLSPDSDTVFYREFVSRTFYTDSTGVVLTYESAEVTSVNLSATVSEVYAASVGKATVYLLTPEQNKTFTAASIQNVGSYTACTDVQFENGNATLTFDRLEHNHHYIARVYVETTGGLKTLTNQALDVMTLKSTAYKKENAAKPQAYYNRATGAYEVFRPTVVDEDGGAESYTYTAYYKDANGKWVEDSKRTITPATGEPVEFHLESGKTYQFGVEMTFNDNEKMVVIDLGRSEEITAVGDTMPKMTLSSTKNDYNNFTGTIHITLGTSSSIDTAQPVELQFYADQIPSEKVTVTDATASSVAGRWTVATNNVSTNSNQCDISIDLKNLRKNTNYSITVYASMNLGDGNGSIQRAIGTVSFRTYDVVTLAAQWADPGAGSHTFRRTLRFDVQDSAATTERTSYALDQLKGGQVTVELFSGTGAGKLRIAQKNFNQPDDLNKIFGGTGVDITESDFGSPNLTSEGNYTLTVTEVVDPSYNMDLGYVNDFDKLLNASSVVTAEPTPPDLLTDPSKGVKAAPIYNVDAAKYGGKVDETLPDDAIVGYTLESTYDNVLRIGRSVTYYAFEYNEFFYALRTGDPLKTSNALMTMTQDIDSGKDTVPKVAVFFGGTKTDDEAAMMTNGYMVYYAGPENRQGNSLVSGMCRGYRYIFAYTVEYSGSTESEGGAGRTYPYGHKNYDNFNKYYGGVTESGRQIGAGVAYILNSGMCEAPKIMPDFHTYVFSSEQDNLSASATTASGNVTLHYSWRDPDKLVKTSTEVGADQVTKISYKRGVGTEEQKIDADKLPGGWYQIKMSYSIGKTDGTELLMPTVNISEYNLDYSTMLDQFHLPLDVTDYPLAKIPLDWSWEKLFGTYNSSVLPVVAIEPHMDENYIAFYMNANGTNTQALENAASRAIAMRLTVQMSGQTADTYTLPLTVTVDGKYYARLATGTLGQKYLDKDFELKKAELIYDTGMQGWNFAQTDSEYAIQYINEKNLADAFAFSRYVGASNNNQIFGNGGLLSGEINLEELRATVAAAEKDDSKLYFNPKKPITGTYQYYFLYPSHMGVDMDNSNLKGQYSGEYAVPKHLKTLELGLPDNKSVTLDRITPVMENEPYFVSTSNGFTASNLKVSGLKTAAEGEADPQIMMAVFESQVDANRLTNIKGNGGRPVDISIGPEGTPTNKYPATEDSVGRFTVSGLEQQKGYFVAFYYIVDGKSVLLLKSGGEKVAIYPVSTSGKVTIDITEIEYRNEDYFTKEIDANFTIGRTYGVKLRYDLFADETTANAENGRPLMSYEELLGNGKPEDSILREPDSITTSQENQLSIHLTPSILRKKLEPGFTYVLKITAQEADSNNNLYEVGSTYRSFTITPVGNYGALIYVKNATHDSITYQVTINDPQYSFMERKKTPSEGRLYTVRFTDKNGRWIHTTYDDEVYSAVVLRKPFVLNNDVLKNTAFNINENTSILSDTDYVLHVYAVPDADHDGVVQIKGEDKTWSDFFDAAGELKDCGTKFLEWVNKLWKGALTPDESMSDVRSTLLVASKQQKTTTSGGWLLNDTQVFASRFNTTTLRIMFQESVGLIVNDSQTFKKIEWSVNGFRIDGTPLSVSGKSLTSKGNQMLVSTTIGGGNDGYDAYYFDIPYEVQQGNYTIVMKFYTTENDAADKTVTITSAA